MCVRTYKQKVLQDLERFLDLRPVFEAAGCGLAQSNSYVWKIFSHRNSRAVEGRSVDYRYPFCDVFVMRRHKDRSASSSRAANEPSRSFTVPGGGLN